MKEMDRRVRRTRARLEEAMLKLLGEKELQSITIQELTRLADVNRGTFYAHYRDLFDLVDQMEEELFQRLEELLGAHAVGELREGLTGLLTDVFRFVRDDPAIRLAVTDPRSRDLFFWRLNQLIVRKCREDWQGLYLPRDEALWGSCLDFLVSGSVGLVRGWLARGCPEPPEEMAALANRMILGSLSPLAEHRK